MLRRKADIKQNPQLYVYGFCFLGIPSLQKKNALPKQLSIQALCRFIQSSQLVYVCGMLFCMKLTTTELLLKQLRLIHLEKKHRKYDTCRDMEKN